MPGQGWGTKLRIWGSGVRISSGAPLRYKTEHSKTCRFCGRRGDKRTQEYDFRAHDANFFRIHFDALGQRAEVVAAVAARLGSHALAGVAGEGFQRLRWVMLGPIRSSAPVACSAPARPWSRTACIALSDFQKRANQPGTQRRSGPKDAYLPGEPVVAERQFPQRQTFRPRG